jgi:hypothetical protein
VSAVLQDIKVPLNKLCGRGSPKRLMLHRQHIQVSLASSWSLVAIIVDIGRHPELHKETLVG